MSISSTTLKKPLEKILEVINSIQGVNNKSKSGNEALINSLKEMENAYAEKVKSGMPDYSSTLPSSTNAVLKTYDEKSEEELRNQAKQAVMPDLNEKINKLNDNTAAKILKLESKLESGKLDQSEDAEKAADEFNADSYNIKNSLARQGIASSSIYQGLQNSALNDYRKEISAINEEFNTLNDSIEKEITLLNTAKDTALLEYDLNAASSIEKKLSTLISNQQTALASINKYNKQLADTESKYQIERAETIAKLEKEWLNSNADKFIYEQTYGYTGDNLIEMNARYDLAKGFYFSLSKSEAKKLLSANEQALKASLGANYYTKLFEENNNR